MRILMRGSKGFTLVELTIMIVIIGLLMSAAIQAYAVFYKRQQVTITQDNIRDARRQIEAFRARYGYYPCPADPADPSGAATDCADPAAINPPSLRQITTAGRVAQVGPPAITAIAPQSVRIGALPVTVILPGGDTVQVVAGEKSVDGYRNRLSYAVIEDMAVPGSAMGDGTIRVRNLASVVEASDRKYILFSAGENGAGAYTVNGTLRQPCGVGGLDRDNCNNSAEFRVLGANEVRRSGGGLTHYDDFTATDVMTNTCSAGQIVVDIAPDGSPVCSATITCPAGRYFAGMDTTVNPVAPICLSHSCPSGSFFTGVDPVTGNPLCTANCPVNTYFAGTLAGGAPDCRPGFVGVSCPAGQVLQGFDVSGNPLCVGSVVAARDMGWWFDRGVRGYRQHPYEHYIDQSQNPDPSQLLYVCGIAFRANCDSHSSEDGCMSVRYCSFR